MADSLVTYHFFALVVKCSNTAGGFIYLGSNDSTTPPTAPPAPYDTQFPDLDFFPAIPPGPTIQGGETYFVNITDDNFVSPSVSGADYYLIRTIIYTPNANGQSSPLYNPLQYTALDQNSVDVISTQPDGASTCPPKTCYSYCLVGTPCGQSDTDISIPLSSFTGYADPGYPTEYITLFPHITNTFLPPAPGDEQYYLVNISDPNYAYPTFLAKEIIVGDCISGDCNVKNKPFLNSNTVTVENVVPTTETCSSQTCYILENCENNLETLEAGPSIAYYLGTVVKISGSDKCWTVKEATFCTDPFNIVNYTVVDVCEDCISCLPTVEPEIPRVLPQYFEDFTQTTENQNQIDVSIKFANAYYQLFKSLKHGMEITCNNVDLDAITIKKKLCDLNTLYDASVCTIVEPTPVTPCDEPS